MVVLVRKVAMVVEVLHLIRTQELLVQAAAALAYLDL